MLPNIRPQNVIVTDSTAYCSHKSELLPTAVWMKEDIKQWLLAKNIPFSNDPLKWILLQTVESVRSEYTYVLLAKLKGREMWLLADPQLITVN
jgi:hypothetical protein